MKKTFLISLLLIASISCSDVKIIESKDNFSCRKELTCFGKKRYSDIESIKYYKKISNKYPISDKKNLEHLKNTKTLFLHNTSETKVYNVTIQKKFNGSKIEYENFTIEPTQKICLGCSEKFYVDLTTGGTLTRKQKIMIGKPLDIDSKHNYYNYEGVVRKKDLIDYKIHKTKVIKEY